MNFIEKVKKMPRKYKIIAGSLVLAVAVIAVVCIILGRNGYLASTMRLLRVEGTVSIEDANGGTKPVTNNLRFQSGEALNTGEDGLASVGLDNTKIVTLQNSSRAEFRKNGKQLELKLTKGAVFFNVTEKLKPEETFEIKTSTMTAGIRGTSGIIYYDEESQRDSLIVTDGTVEVTAVNPDTGEVKHAKVEGGQRIKVYLYSDSNDSHDSVEFYLDEVTEEDLTDFTLQNIVENEELMNRICEYTGWDKEKLKELVSGITSGEIEGQEIELTPTPEPTEAGEQTPTPPPANIADETPTPPATPPATGTPVVTPKPTISATPSPKPTISATPSPKPALPSGDSPTPTPSPTSVPVEYEYVVRNVTFRDHTVTIRKPVDDAPDLVPLAERKFEGLLSDGTWETLRYDEEEDGFNTFCRFYTSDGALYYEYTVETEHPVITTHESEITVGTEPEPPSGYSKTSWCWGKSNGNFDRIYICQSDSDSSIKGYIDGRGWVDLTGKFVTNVNYAGSIIDYYYDEDSVYFRRTIPRDEMLNDLGT